jgi:hypothetical protein
MKSIKMIMVFMVIAFMALTSTVLARGNASTR